MNALEKIKEIEGTSYDCEMLDIQFLLKAFRAMREIAIETVEQELTSRAYNSSIAASSIDQEFEKRMNPDFKEPK